MYLLTKRIILFLLLLGPVSAMYGQAVYENHNSEVYNYLYRMAQKGIIRFDDNIRPLSRAYLSACLDSVAAKLPLLSAIEIKELHFYNKEFSEFRGLSTNNNQNKVDFFKKDSSGRWRSFAATAPNFLLRVDPVLTAATIQGSGKNISRTSSGFNMYGYGGKHWGFYFSYNDVTESGNGLDSLKQFTPETGVAGRIAANKKSLNFSELRAGISYSWKNGSVGIGQDHLLWGYGENGRMVLSDKAPTYPYIRLDYQPVSWLKFNYTHAWLNSNILDSNRSYPTGVNTYGGIRAIYVSKFMASHSVQLTPTKGLDFTFGESMVYSDKLQAGYLIPVLFFKAYDNLTNNDNINAGSNGQFFAQISSRNHIRNTHLYSTFFIDELRVSTLFDKVKSRNQVGLTIGGSMTDLFVPYFTLGLEYTRINPFVYRNLIPAQNYTSDNYVLGDWMGNNADRLIVTARYTPIPRLKCLLRYQSIRKGGAGTLDQQYFQQPQPGFLFDLQNKQKEWLAKFSYEWINNLYLTSYLSSLQVNDITSGKTTTFNSFSIGVSYGL